MLSEDQFQRLLQAIQPRAQVPDTCPNCGSALPKRRKFLGEQKPYDRVKEPFAMWLDRFEDFVNTEGVCDCKKDAVLMRFIDDQAQTYMSSLKASTKYSELRLQGQEAVWRQLKADMVGYFTPLYTYEDLTAELLAMRQKEGEGVPDYTARFAGLVFKLQGHIKEEFACIVLAHSFHPCVVDVNDVMTAVHDKLRAKQGITLDQVVAEATKAARKVHLKASTTRLNTIQDPTRGSGWNEKFQCSYEEFQRRKEQGLCFRCGGGHTLQYCPHWTRGSGAYTHTIGRGGRGGLSDFGGHDGGRGMAGRGHGRGGFRRGGIGGRGRGQRSVPYGNYSSYPSVSQSRMNFIDNVHPERQQDCVADRGHCEQACYNEETLWEDDQHFRMNLLIASKPLVVDNGSCNWNGLFEVQAEVNGRVLRALIDNGATSNFIKPGLVNFKEKDGTVQLGDTSVVKTFGETTADVKVGPSTTRCDFTVMDIPFDVILGTPWLMQSKASLDYKSRTIHLGIDVEIEDEFDETGLQDNDMVALLLVKSTQEKKADEARKVDDKTGDDEEDEDVERLRRSIKDRVADEFAAVVVKEGPSTLPPRRPGYDLEFHMEDNGPPPSQRPYATTHEDEELIRKLLEELIRVGKVRQSTSPFGSPVLLVRQADGKIRLVIDYRRVNDKTRGIAFPTPRIPHLLERTRGAVVFSKMDLMSGFHQIRIAEGHEAPTAFRTTDGLYEWLVVPFGLKNSPAVFCRLLTDILRPLGEFTIVYVDDILIFSGNLGDHESHVVQVLRELEKAELLVKESKCIFATRTVDFLGFRLSGDGVAPDPSKTEAVKKWPTPTSKKEVQKFLGLVNWYKKFVEGFARIASPLYALTAKDTSFVWTEECDLAFNDLKERLCQAPILAHPIPGNPFILMTDASTKAVGGILAQEHPEGRRVIAYESHKLTSTEMNWPPRELEMWAIVHCVRKWKRFLRGAEVVIETDHRSLEYFRTQKELSPKLARWLEDLEELKYKIVYVAGASNCGPDALSRRDCDRQELALPMVAAEADEEGRDGLTATFWTELREQQPATQPHEGTERDGDFWTTDVGAIWVPMPLVKEAILRAHAGSARGHPGVDKTLKALNGKFFWHSMVEDVKEFVRRCWTCQAVKARDRRRQAPFQTLEIPSRPFEAVAIDFIEGMPTSGGCTSILVVVCRFSNFVILVPVKGTIGGERAAELFLKHVFSRYGLPRIIHSDRDSRFTGKFWTRIFSRLGVEHVMGTGYHHNMASSAEKANSTVEQILRAVVGGEEQWKEALPMVEFCVNRWKGPTGLSPFQIVHGWEPEDWSEITSPFKTPVEADRQDDMINLWANVRERVEAARKKVNLKASKGLELTYLQVGQKVFIHREFLPESVTGNRKVYPPWVGEATVVRVDSPVTYEVRLPEWMGKRIHNIFHRDALKVVHREREEHEEEDLVDDGDIFTAEKIIDSKGRGKKKMFRVRWEGYGAEDDTWEPVENLVVKGEPCDALKQWQEKEGKQKTEGLVSGQEVVSGME